MTVPIILSDDVRDVLERSEISELSLVLPGQLDRETYLKVDKVLRAAGGKWQRHAKSHTFGSDPREVLGLAIATGKISDQQQDFQEFLTPVHLAEQICDLAEIWGGTRVLEPSAGTGRIADEAASRGGVVTCVELQERNAVTLQGKFPGSVTCGNFLEQTFRGVEAFDACVINPPFSKGQDIAHVRHAAQFVKSYGGRLVSVMSAGVMFREDKKTTQFREWVDELGGLFIELPDDTFKESGTGVRTVLLSVEF